jgi:hypothetical protein
VIASVEEFVRTRADILEQLADDPDKTTAGGRMAG